MLALKLASTGAEAGSIAALHVVECPQIIGRFDELRIEFQGPSIVDLCLVEACLSPQAPALLVLLARWLRNLVRQPP